MNKIHEQVIWAVLAFVITFLCPSDSCSLSAFLLVFQNPDMFAPGLIDPIPFLLFIEVFLLEDRTTSMCQFPGPTNKLDSYSAASLSGVLRHLFWTLRRCLPAGHPSPFFIFAFLTSKFCNHLLITVVRIVFIRLSRQ